MKKQLILIAAAWLSFGSIIGPAQANEPWFDKWDHNHDNRWNWNEFRQAHYDYWRHHRDERRMTDAELRAEFNRMAGEHHTWVGPDDVRTWHHW